jgi:hypothetical protein
MADVLERAEDPRIAPRRIVLDALARRIGAAGKAVVYQWESRKRTPSPVLWQRVLELERGRTRAATKIASDAM